MDSYISFIDNTQKLNIHELNELRPWIILAAEKEGFSVGELSINFCSDEGLHQINLKFLDHDTFTDIITFDYGSSESIAGEIHISLDRVTENAENFHQDFMRETKRIIIHGVLHLLGYKDKSSTDKSQMTSKEDYYLSLLPDLES